MLLKIYRCLTPRKRPGIIHGFTLGMPLAHAVMNLAKSIGSILDVLPNLPSYLEPPPPAPPPPPEKPPV